MSDDGVSPRKKPKRAEKTSKKRTDEEDEPSSSRKSRGAVKKEKSPERKRKGGKKSKDDSAPAVEIHVDARYQEDDDEDDLDDASDAANTENGFGDSENGSMLNGLANVGDENENAAERLENGTEDDCFEIPQRDDDLLFQGKVGYKIDDVMDIDEAMAAVESFEDEIQQHRWRCLYERFPAFFALVRSPSDGSRADVPAALRSRLVTSLILAYSHMTPYLKTVLTRASSGAVNKRLRAKCRDGADHLLMMIYLLYKLIIIFEDESKSSKRKPVKKTAAKGRAKKAKAVQNEDGDMLSGGDEDDGGMGGGAEDESSWEENRQKVLETLTEMVNFTVVDGTGATCEGAMRFLWKNAMFEKRAVSTLTQCALKFLKNPEITRQPSRGVLTAVFKLIRALCINLKLFQSMGGHLFETLLSLDYYKEGAATAYPFIERIKGVAVKDEMNKLLESMLSYLKNHPVSVSNSNSKALCLFMSNFSEQEPKIVFNSVGCFVLMLKDENASVRSTVLNLLTTLLNQPFIDPHTTQLSESYTKIRKRLFEYLLQHIRDVNANVRASALKCLTSMARFRKIPIAVLNEGLVQMVGQRISDDKVAVRKEAVRFATTLLEYNTYGHDFDRVANEKALKEHLLKRDELRAKIESAKAESASPAQTIFNNIKVSLEECLRPMATEVGLGVFHIPTDEERKTMYANFRARVRAGQLGVASQEDEEEDEQATNLRFLFTTFLSEENEKDMRNPAICLAAMAASNLLKGMHCSKKAIENANYNDAAILQMIMDAGHMLFLHDATETLDKDDENVLRREQNEERWRESIKQQSKNIDDLVMKLVLENEFAQCLPSVMSSVMAGEGGDLKLGIDFVVKCKGFNISGSEAAVRQLCGLVWKSDDEGRNQILQAASSIFISPSSNQHQKIKSTAENILNLILKMSDHERGSVEQVLALTTQFDPIPAGVYDILWEEVDDKNVGGKPSSEQKGKKQVTAMKALCLLSRSDVERNRQWLRRYQNIVKNGWPEIAAEALGCIANLATRHTKEDKLTAKARPYRIPASDSLFRTIRQFMLAEIAREEACTWNRSLRATLDIYFHICKDTCVAVGGFVAKMLWMLRRTAQALHYYDQQLGHEKTNGYSQRRWEDDRALKETVIEARHEYLVRLWSLLTERLCVLAGEVAVRMLVHSDYVFAREFIAAKNKMPCPIYLAQKQREKERQEEEKVRRKKGEPPLERKPDSPPKCGHSSSDPSHRDPADFPARQLLDWEVNSLVRRGVFDWGTDTKEDVEMSGFTDDDRVREVARIMIDQRLESHNQLLGRLLPIIVHAVRAKGSPPRVRFQAMNALSKIMLVSPKAAQYGARTFFIFLNNAPWPILRSNLTVCAADLTFRHPNLVENHSSALFSQLQDSDSCVREACVLILNHLISNDLIKTHSILSYALLGYIDPVPSIQALTKGLFHEWSKKEGIMNHVPSFITKIATDSRVLSLDNFRTIMDIFIPLIRDRKDVAVHNLIHKLTERIKYAKHPACMVRNPDMAAYFSHCMQLLTLNSKGFHTLAEDLEAYQPFLGDDRVFDDITSLVKTFQKDDLKANGGHSDIADEVALFVRKLAELHDQQKCEKDIEGMVARMQFGNKKKALTGGASTSQASVARKMRGRKALASASATPARGGGRTKKANKRRARIDSSSDEGAMDEDSE